LCEKCKKFSEVFDDFISNEPKKDIQDNVENKCLLIIYKILILSSAVE
jgi:hypothetical protein